jgi:(p)ppGpp synthase/HD superfamily hydrolase
MQMTKHDAQVFSIAAHSAVGQFRKHSLLPYYTHPEKVANLLYLAKDTTEEMFIAAYLHDVVEDTEVTIHTIRSLFGDKVAYLVEGLTKDVYPSGTKRSMKFKAEVQRIKRYSPEVKTIKIADSIDNMRDYIAQDPTYARNIYLPEKRILLDKALKEGDTTLWLMADNLIKDFYEKGL